MPVPTALHIEASADLAGSDVRRGQPRHRLHFCSSRPPAVFARALASAMPFVQNAPLQLTDRPELDQRR
jgi:hypothetical protein